MLQFAVKTVVTAIVVVAVSEIAKRSSTLGAIIASLPLTSLLAFLWIYGETGDTVKIAELSKSIFWYVLPSLVLFLVFPAMLSHGFNFWISLVSASALTFAAYLAMTKILSSFGISI